MFEDICQMPTVFIGLTFLLFFWLHRKKSDLTCLPPGPPTQPFVGNALQITHTTQAGKKRIREIAGLVERYGKHGVATLYFGGKPAIFITDLATIKKVLHEEAWNGRPKTIRDVFFGHQGLIMVDGPVWKEQRRFAFNTLRDFTTDKTWLESLVIEEAQELVENLRKTHSEPVDPGRFLTPCVSNVICAIAFGQRFSHEDERFIQIYSLTQTNMKIIAKNQLLDRFPLLRFVPFSPFRSRFLAWMKNSQMQTRFMQEIIDGRRVDLSDEEPRDFIHAYRLEQAKQKMNAGSTFTEVQLVRAIFDLFGAGTDTTSSTLIWALLYMMENPDVYEKVQAEVDGVIRDGNFPTEDDKEMLQYSQATIMEVQRLANMVPIAFRRTLEETTLNEYTIPAGVNVFPLLSAVHEDARYFPDPMAFKPERFLDASGHLLKHVEGFVPFSIGKRFCPGHSLAQLELYIFFLTLVKYFRFRMPPGQAVSSDDSTFGLVNSPKFFTIAFEPRYS